MKSPTMTDKIREVKKWLSAISIDWSTLNISKLCSYRPISLALSPLLPNTHCMSFQHWTHVPIKWMQNVNVNPVKWCPWFMDHKFATITILPWTFYCFSVFYTKRINRGWIEFDIARSVSSIDLCFFYSMYIFFCDVKCFSSAKHCSRFCLLQLLLSGRCVKSLCVYTLTRVCVCVCTVGCRIFARVYMCVHNMSIFNVNKSTHYFDNSAWVKLPRFNSNFQLTIPWKYAITFFVKMFVNIL